MNSTSSTTTVVSPDANTGAKPPGTISAFFDSLSGSAAAPLPQRFADLKRKLVPTPEAERQLQEGWKRLLAELKENNPKWAEKGTSNIPQISFDDLINGDNNSAAARAVLKSGSVVVKGVIDKELALSWKEDIRAYVKNNPDVKGFPENDPQVFELYWTPSQLAARTNPRHMQLVIRLNKLYNVSPSSPISLSNPVLYADRCRERHPGDTSFSLGPHADSGTVERWEDENYASVYSKIVTNWEEYDPWNIDGRVEANTDLYDSSSGSSVLRTFQGWLSLSSTGPGEGTLRVHPSIKHATAYFYMRPFFTPIKQRSSSSFESNEDFLNADNWRLDLDSSTFPGSPPGRAQEFSDATHPHLELGITMTSMPKVEPGDCVFWHCDGIHAVESKHGGQGDSSVMYIPAAPLTRQNALYLARQKAAFTQGLPPPDFPGGVGESTFEGRAGEDALRGDAARAGMGFGRFGFGVGVDGDEDVTEGEKLVVKQANEILGYA